MKKILLAIACVGLLLTACQNADSAGNGAAGGHKLSVEPDASLISAYPTMTVTSENEKNGVWNDIISKTDKGQNRSPQLSWDSVEGASSYVIYMIDANMQYFIHWKSEGITDTTLPEGWASESDYVGPYPPDGGTHTYVVYVIALKNPVERVKGGLNGSNPKFPDFVKALDTDKDGNTGNILSCGCLPADFTN